MYMSIKQPHDFMFMYNGRFKFPQLVLTAYFGAWIPSRHRIIPHLHTLKPTQPSELFLFIV